MTNRQKYIQNVIDTKTKYSIKNEIKRIDKLTHDVVPQIYAAFALTLSYNNYKWTKEQIEDLFNETMALWDGSAREGVNMCEWCEEVTGIDVQAKKY